MDLKGGVEISVIARRLKNIRDQERRFKGPPPLKPRINTKSKRGGNLSVEGGKHEGHHRVPSLSPKRSSQALRPASPPKPLSN